MVVSFLIFSWNKIFLQEEKLKVGNNNGQPRIASATSGGPRQNNCTFRFRVTRGGDLENVAEYSYLAIIWCGKTFILGYPELCHNRLDCFCFVLNLVGVEQN